MGGATGCIAALVNLYATITCVALTASAPKAHVALHKAHLDGDLARARELQTVLAEGDLAQSKLGVAGLKLAVSNYFGYGSGRARRPLPDGGNDALAAQTKVLDRLIQLEKSL